MWKNVLFTIWFLQFITVFNLSYNCQNSHYLGRHWVLTPSFIFLCIILWSSQIRGWDNNKCTVAVLQSFVKLFSFNNKMTKLYFLTQLSFFTKRQLKCFVLEQTAFKTKSLSCHIESFVWRLNWVDRSGFITIWAIELVSSIEIMNQDCIQQVSFLPRELGMLRVFGHFCFWT